MIKKGGIIVKKIIKLKYMRFYAFTNEDYNESILHNDLLSFLNKEEKSVVSQSSIHPFDEEIKLLYFSKNDFCFFGIHFFIEKNIEFIKKEIQNCKIKNVSEENSNEKLFKIDESKDYIFFRIDTNNAQSIRKDYENLIIKIVDFFKDQYKAVVVEENEIKKFKVEYILW